MKFYKVGVTGGLLCALVGAAALRLLTVREIVWEGNAPISLATLTKVKRSLIGKPFWSVTKGAVEGLLQGEMVSSLTVSRRGRGCIVIRSDAPALIGGFIRGDKVCLVDESGRCWATVPVWATHLPIFVIPDGVERRQILPAARVALETFARAGFAVNKLTVNRWGELTAWREDGTVVHFGSPARLGEKARFAQSLSGNGASEVAGMLDVSVPEMATNAVSDDVRLTSGSSLSLPD